MGSCCLFYGETCGGRGQPCCQGSQPPRASLPEAVELIHSTLQETLSWLDTGDTANKVSEPMPSQRLQSSKGDRQVNKQPPHSVTSL